ncbi:MAG TPA: ABC transporter ATP-binding protein [Candidatus Dormibacteraeota bacterium]
MNARADLVLAVLGTALGRRRRDLAAVAAWSAVQAAPALVLGRAVAGAADAFIARHAGAGFAWLAVFALAAATSAVAGWRGYQPMARIVESFRDDLVGRVVGGALRRSTHHGPADTGAVSRITDQVEIVRETFAGLIMLICTFAFTAAGSLLGLFTLAPVAAVFVLPPVAVALALLLLMVRLSARRQRDAIFAGEAVAETASSVVSSLRDIVASGAEEEVAEQMDAPVGAQERAARALAQLGAARALTLAVGGWLPLLALLLAAPWLLRHGTTAGTLLGMLAYVRGGLQPALHTLVNWVGGSGMLLGVTLERIAEVSEEAPPGAALSRSRRTEVPGHGLELCGVTFSYGPNAEPVLRDLDLVIPEGDHLAIVGPSGIGKSTLAGLLTGMLRPLAGEVRMGGVDVATLDAADLPRHRVLIPQEAYVFAGTLLENLTYLRPDVGAGPLEAAVDAVGLRPLVERLGGLGGRVEPAVLSAGERQLVALARSYLSPAPIAVLDEATCHMDPTAEACAERAFTRRPGTLVVIAHRVSSAMRARRILVLDGVRATTGTHETLITSSALYRDLVGHWQSASTPVAPEM